MPRPATGQTPVRNLRVPDEIWEPALANARAEDKTITEVITAALKRYNAAAKRRREKEAEGDDLAEAVAQAWNYGDTGDEEAS